MGLKWGLHPVTSKNHKMKASQIVAVLALSSLAFGGCSKNEGDSVSAPPPPSAPPSGGGVELNAGGPAVAAPPAATPPPEAPAAAMAPAAAPEPEPKEFKDADGKTISLIQHMEALVQGYERIRASRNAETPNQMPPLTDLSQLVTMRMVSRLPAAPAGQKFVLDPATGKVSLAPL